jgi:hypothetical protein
MRSRPWARRKDADNSERTSRVTLDIEPQGLPAREVAVLHEDVHLKMHRGIAGDWPQAPSNLKTQLETEHPVERKMK